MTATSTDDGLDVDATTTAVATTPAPLAPPAPVATPPAPTLVSDAGTAPATKPLVAGAGLIAEAELAVDERRWRDALRVLKAIDSIGASSVHTDGLLAIAATHVNKNRLASEAIGRIRAHPPTAASHRHLARVAIARHQYGLADTESRAAMALARDLDEPESPADWANLAACFTGLGWFDEAAECLDRAEALSATEADTWLVGRSTNHWGLSKSWAGAVGVFLFLFVGLLALAVAMTVPFVAREFRMTQLDDRFAVLADDAWRHERWLRLAHGAGVVIVVTAWSVAMQVA